MLVEIVVSVILFTDLVLFILPPLGFLILDSFSQTIPLYLYQIQLELAVFCVYILLLFFFCSMLNYMRCFGRILFW